MCNEQGGTVDDLYLYRLEEQSFMMVVNASRIQADWEWLMHQKDQHIGSPNAVQCHNLSDQLGALAFQGPLVRTVLDRMAENTQPDCHHEEKPDPVGHDRRISSAHRNNRLYRRRWV